MRFAANHKDPTNKPKKKFTENVRRECRSHRLCAHHEINEASLVEERIDARTTYRPFTRE